MKPTAHGTAVFSDCNRFRQRLSIRWGEGPALAWCCLNPSVAGAPGPGGAMLFDPSARKMRGFSERLGFNAYDLVNLWSFVATDWRDVRAAGFPRHVDDDMHLEQVLRWAPKVIVAWGTHCEGLSRPAEVLRMLKAWGVRPFALRVTRGIPHHPLMLPYSCADNLQEF